jgi:hypothetical protein
VSGAVLRQVDGEALAGAVEAGLAPEVGGGFDGGGIADADVEGEVLLDLVERVVLVEGFLGLGELELDGGGEGALAGGDGLGVAGHGDLFVGALGGEQGTEGAAVVGDEMEGGFGLEVGAGTEGV